MNLVLFIMPNCVHLDQLFLVPSVFLFSVRKGLRKIGMGEFCSPNPVCTYTPFLGYLLSGITVWYVYCM